MFKLELRSQTLPIRLLMLTVLSTLLFASSASAAERASAFVGKWIAYGYFCHNDQGQTVPVPREVISITFDNKQLVATKVVGDDCVTEGSVTWYLETDGLIELGKSYQVDFQVGTPSNPNSGWVEGNIDFLSRNKIVSRTESMEESLVFIRQRTPRP